MWLKAKILLAAGDAPGAEQLLEGAVAGEQPLLEPVRLAQVAALRGEVAPDLRVRLREGRRRAIG